MHPKFHESCCEIFAVRVNFTSKRAEMFANFKLSQRGAIRKPPNVASWVYALETLQQKHGESDTNSVVSTWNSSVAKANQLVGAKGMAVRNVLSLMPAEAKRAFMTHVSEFGWDGCAWTEEVLGSKKIYPGHAPRVGSKSWSDRLKRTEKSTCLMVSFIQADFKGRAVPRKSSKADVEEMADWCAAVVSLAAQVQSLMPIPDEVMESEFIGRFASCDASIVADIQMAVTEKLDKFNVRDIKALANLMDKHAGSGDFGKASEILIEQGHIEKSSFELDLDRAKFDLQAWRVFDKKMASFMTAIAHTKSDWRIKQHKENKDAVQSFLSVHARFTSFEDQNVAERELSKFRASIEKNHQIPTSSVVLSRPLPAMQCFTIVCARATHRSCMCWTLPMYVISPQVLVSLLNWVAPCTFPTGIFDKQAMFASTCCHSTDNAIGLCLTPMFSWKPGQLWLLDHQTQKTMVQHGLNVDKTFGIVFDKKAGPQKYKKHKSSTSHLYYNMLAGRSPGRPPALVQWPLPLPFPCQTT